MKMIDLTLEQLAAALTYDPATGEFRWTAAERPRRRSDLAGTVAANGYVMVRLHGKVRLAHRLAWALHYGQWPEFEIDHVNGRRADNRICNLRDVPHLANMRNHPQNRRLVGAVAAESGRWAANVHRYGKVAPVGEFDTPQEANAAWKDAQSRVQDPNRPRPKVRLLASPVTKKAPG